MKELEICVANCDIMIIEKKMFAGKCKFSLLVFDITQNELIWYWLNVLSIDFFLINGFINNRAMNITQKSCTLTGRSDM